MYSIQSRFLQIALWLQVISGIDLLSGVLYEDNLIGWNGGEQSIMCGNVTMVGGTRPEDGQDLSKIFTLPSPNCVVMVDIVIVALDSWENETVVLEINSEATWGHMVKENEGHKNLCGSSEMDSLYEVSVNVTVDSEEFEIAIHVNLDFTDSEGYGVAKLHLLPICEPVPEQSTYPSEAPVIQEDNKEFHPQIQPHRPSFAPTIAPTLSPNNATAIIIGDVHDQMNNVALGISIMAAIALLWCLFILYHSYSRKWSSKPVYTFEDNVEVSSTLPKKIKAEDGSYDTDSISAPRRAHSLPH